MAVLLRGCCGAAAVADLQPFCSCSETVLLAGVAETVLLAGVSAPLQVGELTSIQPLRFAKTHNVLLLTPTHCCTRAATGPLFLTPFSSTVVSCCTLAGRKHFATSVVVTCFAVAVAMAANGPKATGMVSSPSCAGY